MLTDNAFRRALTLRERAAVMHGHLRPMTDHPGLISSTPDAKALTSETSAEPTHAQRRASRWQQQCGAGNAERFAQRLAAEQLSLDDLPLLLDPDALPSDQTAASTTPSWWRGTSTSALPPLPDRTAPPHRSQQQRAFFGFLAIAAPQLRRAHAQLLRALRVLPGLRPLCASPEHLTDLATSALASDIAECVAKVLVLELNVMRLRGGLVGNTGDERFQHFLRTLDDDATRQALFNEYPVLLRTIELRVQHWYRHTIELLQRLTNDRHAIETRLLDGVTLGKLTDIAYGAGDKHRGGRCVTILTFDNGQRIVYKPRSLAVDLAFQQLVAWSATGTGDNTLRQPAHLPCGAYGWSAFVEHLPGADTEAIKTFYRRMGAQLALLFILDATDMHLENVIAHGDTPVLVDLEALFHPRLDSVVRSADARTAAPDEGWSAYNESVMRVGLLPSWSYHNADGEGIELSGIGGAADQLLPDEQQIFSAIGQDTMCIVRQRVRLPNGKNQPHLDNQRIDPAAYANAIVDGFRATYLHLVEHRDYLLSNSGPLTAFRNADVRAVFRHTKAYATLLRDAHHPDLLRDAIDRDIHFDALWRAVETRPWFAQLVPHELEDLQVGDVPHFTTRPASTSVWTANGTELPNFFSEDAFSRVQHRIQALDPTDCERQCWFIQAALAVLATDTHITPTPATDSAPATADQDTPRNIEPRDIEVRARDMARQVADRLVHLALQRNEAVNWLGVSLVNDKHWSLQPLGDDLYNGRLGVALFLLECDRVLGHPEARALARRTLDSCVGRLASLVDGKPASAEHRSTMFRGSAFHGNAGEAFVLAHAARTWNLPHYATLAWSLLERSAEGIAYDDQLDVIGGVAGCALVAGTLIEFAPPPKNAASIAALIEQAGLRLLAKAEQHGDGLAWTTRIDAALPLTGLSHGASGIALALHRAGRVLGRSDFLETARQAVLYERHAHATAEGRWPDYRRIAVRPPEGGWSSMNAWCHGASGIGLVRLEMLASQSSTHAISGLQRDLEFAVRDTLLHGFSGNHSLCHGMLGNYALLHDAARITDSTAARQQSDTIARGILDSIDRVGVQCGIPRGIETPGLMTGLAGVGLGLLKMGGANVADVLTMKLPSVG
ncbi:MAG TPA: type 2 lanthipeptide synthetase LanM family protein [Gemmatimonas sp.]|uniref:type 2 lanthipeptide synthetase LanM family protein n=1 Tax=Gemmatimonas sp. TaxID=1962908 RepID=UPI002ED8AEC2